MNAMKIAIFGATGHTGHYVLRDALAAGHSASVLVRNPSKLPPGKYNLTIHLGDATDADNVEDAIFGQQAVISALGLGDSGAPGTMAKAMQNIVAGMQANGVQRLVAVAGAGILRDRNTGGLRIDAPAYPQQYRVYGEEHRRVYEVLQASNLDWTLICPPAMYEPAGETEAMLRWELDMMPEHGKQAAYAGVARFTLEALGRTDTVRRTVGVAE
jgi:putative NADH-flavin reductase